MDQKRSLTTAWWHPDTNEERWSKKMLPLLEKKYWRKASQWFTLVREHAQIVLEDVELYKVFEEHCVYDIDFENMRHRKCFSDEHYVPTLLSIHGLEDETVSYYTASTFVDWSHGGAHPKSFKSHEISPSLFHQQLRSNQNCPLSTQEQQDVQMAYIAKYTNLESFKTEQDLCDEENDKGNGTQGIYPPGCSFLARKFEANTTRIMFHTLTRCDTNLQIIPC